MTTEAPIDRPLSACPFTQRCLGDDKDGTIAHLDKKLDDALDEIERLEAEITRLRTALAFYANKDDGGTHARAALEAKS